MGDGDLSAPLDFEFDDPLTKHPPPVVNKRRKNVIGLDQLLDDFYTEQKLVKQKTQRAKFRKNNNSDDDEKNKRFLKIIEACENQINDISEDENNSLWGVQVFGNQKSFPPLVPELGSIMLLQSFIDDEVNSMVNLTKDKAESFLEGLLENGWLLQSALVSGTVERSIAIWTFNLMLYSPKEEFRKSACDFWCSILPCITKSPIKVGWLPEYSDLRRALEDYGFLFIFSSTMEAIHVDSDLAGPSQNIRAWFKFVNSWCQIRSMQSIFSTSQAEEMVEIIMCLFLDRQLQGLMGLMCDCLQAAISCFKDEEWNFSCKNIAKFVACRVSTDVNCLRIVECIQDFTERCKQLRSAVAHQLLLICLDNEVLSEEDIMRSLISLDMKDKSNDFFKLYICLVLSENWLLYGGMLEQKQHIHEMWGLFLRNCCCQISIRDLRTYAAKFTLPSLVDILRASDEETTEGNKVKHPRICVLASD